MLPEPALAGSSLCVIGNINRDIKTTPLSPGPHLFEDGESAVAGVTETIGGGGANSAFTAAALGATVRFVGKTGNDGLGQRLARTLGAHRIASHLAYDESHPSGTSLALGFTNGHRHFVSCLPSSRALTYADVDLRALEGCDHLLRADVWFSESMLWEGNERLFRAARARGLAVSLDLNWDPAWGVADRATIERRKQAVLRVLPWVTLAHGNVTELCAVTEAEGLEAALQRLTERGAGAVVVHLGERGAGFYSEGTLTIEPPLPAPHIVNATGTGDVLSTCMILLHRRAEMPIADKLRLANRIVSEFMAGKRNFIPAVAD